MVSLSVIIKRLLTYLLRCVSYEKSIGLWPRKLRWLWFKTGLLQRPADWNIWSQLKLCKTLQLVLCKELDDATTSSTETSHLHDFSLCLQMYSWRHSCKATGTLQPAERSLRSSTSVCIDRMYPAAANADINWTTKLCIVQTHNIEISTIYSARYNSFHRTRLNENDNSVNDSALARRSCLCHTRHVYKCSL